MALHCTYILTREMGAVRLSGIFAVIKRGQVRIKHHEAMVTSAAMANRTTRFLDAENKFAWLLLCCMAVYAAATPPPRCFSRPVQILYAAAFHGVPFPNLNINNVEGIVQTMPDSERSLVAVHPSPKQGHKTLDDRSRHHRLFS